MTPSSQIYAECRFCLHRDKVDSAVWDQRLLWDGSVNVLPSKGAIVAPWLLIVPTSHVPSAALLPHHEKKSIARLVEEIRYLAGSNGQELIIFENGSPYFGADISCGIEHVHIHLVALDFSLVNELRIHLHEKNIAPEPWSVLAKPPDTAYIYVDDGKNQVYFDASSTSSQFVRRIIAFASGCEDEFHYDLFPKVENVSATVDWFKLLSLSLAST
jgi:ATP adenylyltransferase